MTARATSIGNEHSAAGGREAVGEPKEAKVREEKGMAGMPPLSCMNPVGHEELAELLGRIVC